MAQSRPSGQIWHFSSCALIVAHPDDETLWAGGTMLMHPEANWTVITICRASDQDRSPRFFQALDRLNATGSMGDLDNGPDQSPLPALEVQDTVTSLLPSDRFDLIVTHSLWGEYTQNLRHVETAKAVLALCRGGSLFAKEVWMFAYEDGGGKYLPRPVRDADVYIRLTEEIWQQKYDLITKVYGFAPDSFEAKATPREEAFWLLEAGRSRAKA
ncbi:MAG: PIG-L deacetylase family protein [Planctomycetota bacterium]